MKKIFTLAVCLTSLATVFAQSPYSKQPGNQSNDHRNDGYTYAAPPVINNGGYGKSNDNRDQRFDRRYNDQYSFSTRERDAVIFRINQEYASRMNAVKFNRFMRNGEKRRELRNLENQRDFEIKKVYARFDDNRNKFNDKYYDRNYNWRH